MYNTNICNACLQNHRITILPVLNPDTCPFQCTVKHVKEHSECPHTDCYKTVSIDDKQLRWFQAILDTIFKEYHSVNTPEVESVPGGEGKLYVTSLTGESLEFDYAPTLTVLDVMKQIQLTLGHATNKQKLLYNETELKVL